MSQGASQGRKPHIPPAPKPKKQHSIWFYLMLVVLLGLLVLGGAAFKVYRDLQSIDTLVVPAQSEPYELKEGATLQSVVRDLTGGAYLQRVVSLWVKLHHLEYPVIQKGPYLIDGTKTLPQILADMREGNIIKIKLPTIALIEGMTVSMVERRLLARTELVQDQALAKVFTEPRDFITSVLTKESGDDSLLRAIGGAHDNFEGLLMPATYEYEPGKTQASWLLAQALTKMAYFMREQYLERDQSIDKVVSTPYQVLIMASLVERESSLEEERTLIAGVFLNRLRKGMMLQTDPAVMYGVSPDFRGPLLRSQLKRDTPYNTYTRAGLPPTPIAMPSESSIMAVLHPASTKALYFVAKGPDPDDGHVFSETLAQHNKAVREYRRAVRAYKKSLEQ